jgi:cobaltochelatase CobS
MFVIQRVLEASGKLTLLDQNRIISPHPFSGCSRRRTRSGSATPAASITARSRSTRAQMDRWSIVTNAQLPRSRRPKRPIVLAKNYRRTTTTEGRRTIYGHGPRG